jgi:4-alpha-glucanotransferase
VGHRRDRRPARAGALLAPAGVALIQILPINEIAGGNSSPYGALSAFGIDPMYITLTAVDDLKGMDNAQALGHDGAELLAAIAPRPRSTTTPSASSRSGPSSPASSASTSASCSPRSEPPRPQLPRLRRRPAPWLADYALYRAIKDDQHGLPWWEWPAPLRERDAEALRQAEQKLADAILYFKYAQWLAHAQWSDARAASASHGVEIMGDLPFMVDRDSADVWAQRHEFRLDMSVGCPADQFDKDGQDWGLPPYYWGVMAKNDFAWLRRRARYSGELYDRFRIDHLVGFFRTTMRPYDARRGKDGKLVAPRFDPPDEHSQRLHGERVVAAMIAAAAETGAQLIAEDLGSIPDYVPPPSSS